MKTYDPKKVIVVFGGVSITGYADGTFVSVAPATERFSKVVGADGEVARARSNDNTHEVTITLMQTSASNDDLADISGQDRDSNSGVRSLTIKDISGKTLMFWPEAWIRQTPNVEFAKTAGERGWVFDTGQITTEDLGGVTAV